MARKSSSSSTTNNTNGYATATADDGSKPAKRIIPETDHEDDEDDDAADWDDPQQYEMKVKPMAYEPSLFPGGNRSLSAISLQAFLLGFVLALCCLTTAWLVNERKPTWRLPAFFLCLSLFHFLEFWTTARFNTQNARASSFLLYSNGAAYNIAHALATVEVITSTYIPSYQARLVSSYSIGAGVLMVVVGQLVRSVAMAQAGTNFNHIPARAKKEGHVLVSAGVYAFLRHPSYFGFFWWALGTQLLVGNKLCLVGYLIVLFRFFYKRIKAEEVFLVDFFGTEYEEYRKRTGTGIPFIS